MRREMRWIALMLFVLFMGSLVPGSAAETMAAQTNFEAALHTGTQPDILDVFSAISSAEGDPMENLNAARQYSSDHGLLREFNVWLNGALAGENGSVAVLEGYSAYRLGNGTRMNEAYGSVPSEILESLASDEARRVGAPSLWTDERFLDRFGVSMAEFIPSSPYGGFCLMTASGEAYGSPTHPYTESEEALADYIEDVKEGVYRAIEEVMLSEGLFFSGNPDTASVFLKVDIQYPFYSYYGNRSYSGYDTDVAVTATDAVTRREIAVLKGHNRLGDSVSVSGSSGKVWAKFPTFEEDTVRSFARKIYEANAVQIRRESEGTTFRDILEDDLMTLAGKCTDPWQKAILLSGAKTVSVSGDTLSFMLCGYDPDTASIEDLKDDPAAYLTAASENSMRYSLTIEAPLKEGQIDAKTNSAILAAVKKAAAASKKAYTGKAMLNALQARYFPQPAAAVKKASELLETEIDTAAGGPLDGYNAQCLAILFYGRTRFSLDVSKGPEELSFVATGISPEAIMNGAADALVAKYEKVSFSNRTPFEEIREAYLLELAERCIKGRKSGKGTLKIPLRSDNLGSCGYSDEYYSFLDRMAFSEELDSVAGRVEKLPDYAAIAYPKNGIISGGRSGTKVIVKTPKDGNARYVQIRRSWDDRVVAILFIHSGKSVSFKAQQGEYYLLYAEGKTWYGEEAFFGSETAMGRTDDFDVPSSRYYLTLTLKPVANGNLGLRRADPSMFGK